MPKDYLERWTYGDTPQRMHHTLYMAAAIVDAQNTKSVFRRFAAATHSAGSGATCSKSEVLFSLKQRIVRTARQGSTADDRYLRCAQSLGLVLAQPPGAAAARFQTSQRSRA
jgi:hypothetical protein